MSGSVAMLNVRMDRSTKEAGDAALANLGVSVSEITRALWQKLAQGGDTARRQVERIMAPEQDDESAAIAARKKASLARVDESWSHISKLLGETGVPALPDDKDALAEARYAYLQEKWGEL